MSATDTTKIPADDYHPLPWSVGEEAVPTFWEIYDSNGCSVCTVHTKSNANRIVKAVNGT